MGLLLLLFAGLALRQVEGSSVRLASILSRRTPSYFRLFNCACPRNRLAFSNGASQQPPNAVRRSRLHMSSFEDGYKRPEVVVTGLGVISGIGVGVENFWSSLIEGKSGIAKVNSFDVEGMACQLACQVSDEQFNAKDWFKEPKDVKRNDRYSHFALAASKMALDDAGIDSTKLEPSRFGVIVGSGIGGIKWLEDEHSTMLEKGHKRVSPFLIPAMIANTAPALVAIEFNAQGPNHGVVSACATAGHAIGTALRLMQAGDADIMIVGGAEASLTSLTFAGFNNLRAMANGWNDDPQRASRPFDAKRSGFVMGEGAGILVLETLEHAEKRGANKVYGDLAGYGATCDAHHITAPAPGGVGLAKAITLAMKEARIDPDKIGYLNAHGTSTPYNDKFETAAIKAALGEQRARNILVSSIKSMTGHTLGAAGGIEAVACAKALETGVVPPTINYEFPDPDCDLNYVPNKAVQRPLEAVISTTLGFGGHNAALLMKRH
eukprot:GHVN01072045.1.p1 GENE.GHVN01072045.1~~GHVN01072045.1.p1  ORF type:complete len:493 (+),score=49.66 GHVN01072045.1:46-1524(+)